VKGIVKQKFQGSMPDSPPRTEGAVLDVFRMWPHAWGIKVGPSTSDFGTGTALAEQPTGMKYLLDSGYASARYIANSTKILRMASTSAMTDVSRGGGYSANPAATWSFCQFGNISIGANRNSIMQQRLLNSVTPFANIVNSPQADIVFTAGPAASPFLIALNYVDLAFNVIPDGWITSSISDYTQWIVGTLESASGIITDNPGPLTAGIAFKDGAVIFKEDAMFIGEYVGSPIIWAWRRISSDIGCIGKNACININDVLYFAGREGLYTYDGSYPRKIPGQVQDKWAQFFKQYCAQQGENWGVSIQRPAHQVMYWPENHLIAFVMCLGPSGTGPRFWLWFNTRTGMWIFDGRFVISGFEGFVDSNCYIDSTSGPLKPSKFVFDGPRNISGSLTTPFQGDDGPDIITVAAARPLYVVSANIPCTVTAMGQMSDMYLGAGGSSADEFQAGTQVVVQPGPGSTNNHGWADFAGQQWSANLIRANMQWDIAGTSADIIVNGMMYQLTRSGKDHG
jgi:hypothetical protein